jgi:hypothetical protein
MVSRTIGVSVAAAIAVAASAGASYASSSLTTDSSGYTGPQLDLSAFANGSYNFTFGPVTLPGGIVFTASPGGSGGYPFGGNSGDGSVIGQGSYGLGDNGSFGGSATYIGVDSGTGSDTLTFATPVSEFGAFWNYAPGNGDDPTLTVLDSSDAVIASYDLASLAPISTPGGFNEFEFRGIVDSTADIKSIEFGGSYLLLAGTASGGIPGTPEPSTWALIIVGFLGLGLVARRSSRGRAAALAG